MKIVHMVLWKIQMMLTDRIIWLPNVCIRKSNGVENAIVCFMMIVMKVLLIGVMLLASVC
jgi:hypothetical protein